FEMGVFPIPVTDESGAMYSTHVKGIKTAVVSSSKNKEAALKFLAFLSDKDSGAKLYYDSIGHFPTVQGVESKEPMLKIWEPVINMKGITSMRDQVGTAVANALYTGLQELWTNKPVEEIAAEIQS